MPADPVEAGRKGGRSRSAAKLAAIRRNGFQPRKPAQETAPVLEQGSACPVAPAQPVAPRPAVLIAPRTGEPDATT